MTQTVFCDKAIELDPNLADVWYCKRCQNLIQRYSAILKKASGKIEEKEGIKETLSPSAKAYRLFSKDRTPIQVAISLNLSEAETTKFYEEYWNLEQMHGLRQVYDEIGADIVHLLKLYRLSKTARMTPEHIVNLLRFANNDLPALELRRNRLRKEINSLEFEKQKSKDLGNQVIMLTKVLDETEEEIRKLQKKRMRLEALMTSDYYKKVRQVVEAEVTNLLSERSDLMKIAISSVIESIIRDPYKYNFLIGSSQFNHGQNITSQTYFDTYRALIEDDALILFKVMKRELTNRVIDNTPLESPLTK